MFKEYGQVVRTAEGEPILRISGIASYCLLGSHGLIQTQMRPREDIWRTAVLFESNDKFKMSCTKWNFCFVPHLDGGYQHIQKDSHLVPLDEESSKLIKDLIYQYRELKRTH